MAAGCPNAAQPELSTISKPFLRPHRRIGKQPKGATGAFSRHMRNAGAPPHPFCEPDPMAQVTQPAHPTLPAERPKGRPLSSGLTTPRRGQPDRRCRHPAVVVNYAPLNGLKEVRRSRCLSGKLHCLRRCGPARRLACRTGAAGVPSDAFRDFPVASEVRLAATRRRRMVVDFSQKIDMRAFTLADPYRVIIDLPQVIFRFPAATERRGLIRRSLRADDDEAARAS